MKLPTEKTKPKTDLSMQKILIHGIPKIGKSTFASQFPNAIFAAAEPGLNFLEAYQEPISSWVEFREFCRLIKNGDHKFKTVILDTVDALAGYCSEFICNEHGLKHESELANNAGYALVNQEMARVFNKLASLPYGLVMISHTKIKTVKGPVGDYDKATPDLSGGKRKVVENMAEFILYFTLAKDKEDGKKSRRVIHTKPNKHWVAGDKSGRLPETMLLDYPTFEKYYNEGVSHDTEKLDNDPEIDAGTGEGEESKPSKK